MCADLPYVEYEKTEKKKYNPESEDYKKVVDLNKQIIEKMKIRRREADGISDEDYETHKLS